MAIAAVPQHRRRVKSCRNEWFRIHLDGKFRSVAPPGLVPWPHPERP